MSFIEIDKEKCLRDGACIAECPFGLLVKDDEGFPKAIEEAEKSCLACGHCIAVCPRGVLKWKETSPDELVPIRKELQVGADNIEQFLKGRRSSRLYKNQPVSHDILMRLVDCARWAPTAKNMQPVHWIIVEKPVDVRKLAGMTVEALRGAKFLPEVIEAWDQGKDMVLRGAPHLVIAHAHTQGFDPTVDCTIAMTFFDLMANALGLGTCWAGMFMFAANRYKPLVEYLQLPEGHKVWAAMMVGYPKFKYHRIPPRNPSQITWR